MEWLHNNGIWEVAIAGLTWFFFVRRSHGSGGMGVGRGSDRVRSDEAANRGAPAGGQPAKRLLGC